jgi:hypothetical protein
MSHNFYVAQLNFRTGKGSRTRKSELDGFAAMHAWLCKIDHGDGGAATAADNSVPAS